VSDKFSDGRSFRILTAIDQFTRECVALEADHSMTGTKVAEALERVREQRGFLPESITVDNGSEPSGRALEAWVVSNNAQLCLIRRGRPVENGFIESFNGRLRDECLNVEWFSSLEDVREKLRKFREHYNHKGPHSPLADRAPADFAKMCSSKKELSPQAVAGDASKWPEREIRRADRTSERRCAESTKCLRGLCDRSLAVVHPSGISPVSEAGAGSFPIERRSTAGRIAPSGLPRRCCSALSRIFAKLNITYSVRCTQF